MPTDQYDMVNPSTEVPSSQATLVCVKLTKVNQHQNFLEHGEVAPKETPYLFS